MNRQEAIEVLTGRYLMPVEDGADEHAGRVHNALGLAIDALNHQTDYEQIKEQRGGWIPCTEPPENGRNVFLAHGTNNFKSCCIGHYEHSMGMWYEDRNFFAKPIYDCKYWCEIPELPDMGENQFEQPHKEGEE